MIKIFIVVFSFILSSCSLPSSNELRQNRYSGANRDLKALYEDPALPNRCLTLEDIIQITLARNLDLAIQEQVFYIRNDVARREALGMLPEVLYNLDYSYRNKNTASTGKLLEPPHSPLLPATFSSEQRSVRYDYTVLWNILDLGITYFRSKQDFDQAAIALFEIERAKQNLILRAVQLYWRAAISKAAVEIADPLVKELAAHRERVAEELKDQDYLSQTQAYRRMSSFFTREIQLKGFNDRTDSSDPTQGYEKEYQNALLGLAELMRLPPDYPIDICIDKTLEYEVDFADMDLMERWGMMYRPELYTDDLQEQIAVEDVNIALLQFLPNLQLFYGEFHDSNKFLVHKNWWSAGTRLAINFLSWPQHYYEVRIGEESQRLARTNRLQTALGIMVQIHLAEILYEQNKEQFLLAKNVADYNENISENLKKASAVGMVSDLEALSARIDTALARINSLKVYAEMQNSLELVNNAIGLPRFYQTSKNIENHEDNPNSPLNGVCGL